MQNARGMAEAFADFWSRNPFKKITKSHIMANLSIHFTKT